MGIALLSLAGFFHPLRSMADRWLPPRRSRTTLSAAGLRYVGVRPGRSPHGAAGTPAARAAAPARPAQVLRVSRTLDATRHGASAGGRLVISGRMADVCAELDRLAALEAAGAGSAGRHATR